MLALVFAESSIILAVSNNVNSMVFCFIITTFATLVNVVTGDCLLSFDCCSYYIFLCFCALHF